MEKPPTMEEQLLFAALHEAQQTGTPVALATVIRTTGSMPRHAGSKMIIFEEGRIQGTVGGGAMEARVIADGQAALVDGQTRLNTYVLNDLRDGDPGICGGSADIFIEPIRARPLLLVIGGGHVGKALAELGKWAGFRVALSDDRPAFCNPEYAPGLDAYHVVPPAELLRHVPLGPNVYVAAVTRGLPVDEKLLPSLLRADPPPAYLGLIGSRRRWALTIKALESQGFARQELARVHAPIGLELNAETPQEIAISIMAEITMIRRGGTGAPMRWLGVAEEA
jgi:xanthine dehydrogenase accessory factor